MNGGERRGGGGGRYNNYGYYENEGGEKALGGGGREEEGSGGNFCVNPMGRLDEPGEGRRDRARNKGPPLSSLSSRTEGTWGALEVAKLAALSFDLYTM